MKKGWGCGGCILVGVAALWVVCFLWGWNTMPPVFRQAYRSLFYNKGGAAINGQMMWTTLDWFTMTNSPLQVLPHLLLPFSASPMASLPFLYTVWTKTMAAAGAMPPRLDETHPLTYTDTPARKCRTYIWWITVMQKKQRESRLPWWLPRGSLRYKLVPV